MLLAVARLEFHFVLSFVLLRSKMVKTNEEFAQQINNLSYKFSQTFVYNNNKTDDIFKFPNKLGLSSNYVYTLKMNSYFGWHSLVNISADHNKIRYSLRQWKNMENDYYPRRYLEFFRYLFKNKIYYENQWGLYFGW